MRLIAIFCLSALCVAASLRADVAISIDRLHASDGGPQPSADIVVVDISVDVGPFDAWSIGAIRGIAMRGARLRYALDPETALPKIVNPGLADRFVTSVSRPLPRHSDARLTDAEVSSAGRYSPALPTPVATLEELNLSFFANPLPNRFTPSADGCIARIALDITGICSARGAQVFRTDEVPEGFVPIFLSTCDTPGDAGSVAATRRAPEPVGFDWGVYMVDKAVTCAEDFDCNRVVDISDLMLFLSGYGTCRGNPAFDAWLDLNNDGCVELSDLSRMLAAFGGDCRP